MQNLTEKEVNDLKNVVMEFNKDKIEEETSPEEKFEKWISSLRDPFYLFNTLREQLYIAYCQGLAVGQTLSKEVSLKEVDKMLKDQLFIEQVKDWIENPKTNKLPDNKYVEVIGDFVGDFCKGFECNKCVAFPDRCEGPKINLEKIINEKSEV